MNLDLDFNGKREVVTDQLKEGDIVEDRYKILNFQKDCGWNLPSGNVWDLKGEKIKKINDVKIDHWDEPKKYEIVKNIGIAMNKIDHPNIVKKEVFAIADNGRIYRIARHIEETPEDKSLYNLIILKSIKNENFTDEEILDVVYSGATALKYLNSMNFGMREKISAKNFMFMNGTKLFIEYWNLTFKVNKIQLKDPPLNLTMDFLWILGKMIYEMATLKISSANDLFQSITKEKLQAYQNAKLMSKKHPRLPEFPQNYSPKLNSIYERLIEVLPQKRPTANEILEMIEGKLMDENLIEEKVVNNQTPRIEKILKNNLDTERKSKCCCML